MPAAEHYGGGHTDSDDPADGYADDQAVRFFGAGAATWRYSAKGWDCELAGYCGGAACGGAQAGAGVGSGELFAEDSSKDTVRL